MRKEKKVLPLSAIGYFAVAARHLNFNHAAAEIGITPGAMSLRVKALEENIGHPLFVRGTRGVTLTPDGERLKEIADFAIRQLEGVINDIREGPRREKLVVTVSPYFGSKWLASRLVGFWLSQPDIDLQLRRYREDLSFEEMSTDVLIRYGKSTSSDLVCKTLIPARTVAVCGPTFLSARKSPDLSIFEEGPLLHVGSRRDWADWLEAIDYPREWAESGQVVEDIHVAIEAAAAGQGLVLGTRPLIDDDLELGRLNLADDAHVDRGYSYQLIYRKSVLQRQAVQAFVNWITAQARKVDPHNHGNAWSQPSPPRAAT